MAFAHSKSDSSKSSNFTNERKKVSFADRQRSDSSSSEEHVFNPKASKARQAYLKHNNDRDDGGRIKLAKGHIVEGKSSDALQFFATHHDYRKGKIRENYVPQLPDSDKLYENATLTPGSSFQKAMYEDVIGLICENANREPVCIEQIGDFDEANLSPKLLANLAKMKITQPLPIQCFLIPFFLNHPGKNIVASAPTGSGKTLAVMLPMIEICIRAKRAERYGSRPSNAPYIIVIGATRDLVHQFWIDTNRLSNDTGIQVKTAYGEYQRETNAQHIREGCDILIATTGRFVDLVDKEDVLVNHARYLAVDEADKLVVDELIQDLSLVLRNRIRPDIVHALFSATFNPSVINILPKLLQNDFIRVELKTESISPTVKQEFYNVEEFDRKEFVVEFLKNKATVIPDESFGFDTTNFMHPVQYHVPKTIIYAEARRTIDYLAIYLSMKGIRSFSMHGGRSQSQRNEAWKGFTDGAYQVLCASNVAARGINFPNICQIINFDAPVDWDTYVHRIGRAGRLGVNAKAITFLNPADTQHMMLASFVVPELQKLKQKIPSWLQSMSNMMIFGTQDDATTFMP